MLDLYNMIGALIPTAGPTKAHPDDAYREGYAAAVDDTLEKVDSAPDASTAAIVFALQVGLAVSLLCAQLEPLASAARDEYRRGRVKAAIRRLATRHPMPPPQAVGQVSVKFLSQYHSDRFRTA